MKEKMYPFSGTKHAHDIDFRRARCKNELYEKSELNELLRLEAGLDELIGYMHEGVCWIPAYLYGLAQESVAWAAMQRSGR